jgi:hypothetical protein
MIRRIIALSAVLTGITALAFAQTPSADEIMKKWNTVEEGNTSTYIATMTLTNAKGAVRTREFVFYKKKFGDIKKSILVFRTPKDVSGIGYLMWEYKEENGVKKDSDNWLYMPAMKKVRRISGSDSGGDFMGTDFTYDDIGDRGITKDTFTFLGEENVDGQDCWKIECKAKKADEKNPKRIVWIRKDNYLEQKAEYYNHQDKVQRILSCSGIKQIDGIWTTPSMTMKNTATDHTTVIEMKDVHYNQDINNSYFTVASVERGAIK